MSAPFLSIIGIGEDGVAGLSEIARDAIRAATLVVGGARHLELARALITGEAEAWQRPFQASFPSILARRPAPVVVLASGDPFFHGVGPFLAALVAEGEWRCIPQISCVTLACARLGWAQNRTRVVSLCGPPVDTLARYLFPATRLLVLSADDTTPAIVALYLAARGYGASEIVLLEALGGPDERIRRATADGWDLAGPHKLNLLAITLRGPVSAALVPGRDDAAFEHDGQITKHDIRATSLAALSPLPGELLWDVGTGSGSVAIEWLLAHRSLRAIGIDRHAERLDRAGRNAAGLGVPHLQLVHGEAPGAFDGLPTPDAIFLGGGAHLPGVIEAASAALRSGGRLVANASALETEAALIAAQSRQGGALSRIGIERLDNIGRMQAYRPAMTVTQYLWVKR